MFDRSGGEERGKPFNIASRPHITMMVARATGYEPGVIVRTFEGVHPYPNRREPADVQLAREPRPFPRVRRRDEPASLFDFRYEVVDLVDCRCHPTIRAAVSA